MNSEQVRRRWQNRVAESSLTMPVAIAFTVAVGAFIVARGHGWWGQLLCLAATAYLLAEMNTAHALLRVRSRMVSSTFLALSCASCALWGGWGGSVSQLCLGLALFLLLGTYQDRCRMGTVFYAFLFLGFASLFFIQIVLLVPVLWVLMATALRCLSWRSWMASLIGLLLPYWMLLPWLLWTGDVAPATDHLASLLDAFRAIPLSPLIVPLQPLLLHSSLFILGAASIIHLSRYSYEDKIRVQQFMATFSWLAVAVLLLTILLPQFAPTFLRLQVLLLSPLVAHLFTFTSTRVSNYAFIFTLLCIVAFTAFCLASV